MGAEVPRAALVDAFRVGGCCLLIKVFVCLHGICSAYLYSTYSMQCSFTSLLHVFMLVFCTVCRRYCTIEIEQSLLCLQFQINEQKLLL